MSTLVRADHLKVLRLKQCKGRFCVLNESQSLENQDKTVRRRVAGDRLLCDHLTCVLLFASVQHADITKQACTAAKKFRHVKNVLGWVCFEGSPVNDDELEYCINKVNWDNVKNNRFQHADTIAQYKATLERSGGSAAGQRCC